MNVRNETAIKKRQLNVKRILYQIVKNIRWNKLFLKVKLTKIEEWNRRMWIVP